MELQQNNYNFLFCNLFFNINVIRLITSEYYYSTGTRVIIVRIKKEETYEDASKKKIKK